MQTRDPNNAQGIDVSHHQGIINWEKVKASGQVDFAFIKATEGLGYVDPKFKQNAVSANAVGIPVGYYHYAHPETNRALDEARAFVEATNGPSAQLPYVLDLEGTAANLGKTELITWALVFMREVKKLTCADVMLYTGAYFARDEVGIELAEFPLWIAHYGASTPLANGTWDKWTCFQYTSSGSVTGIIGNVDLNEYNGSVNDLAGYKINKADADLVIGLLGEAYRQGVTKITLPDGTVKTVNQAEIHRLANVQRVASGQPSQ